MFFATEGTEITENRRDNIFLGVLGELCGVMSFLLLVVPGEAGEPLLCVR